MTTAHRPTFNPAKGGPDQGGTRIYGGTKSFSAKDLPGFLTLKDRQSGQNTRSDVSRRDLKAELTDKEAKHRRDKEKDERRRADRAAILEEEREKSKPKLLTSSADLDKNIDADDEDDAPVNNNKSDDEDDDEEDETAELMKELERIKRERADEQRKKELERQAQEKKEKDEAVIKGNPLIGLGSNASFSVKRRWDDDVVFKNQTKGAPVLKKRFINDTVRNDFHKRFLEKYIQ
eukprot:CAMPEP_0184655832 /NCGR_PEP_ID=MMETSP0308-20130426/14564_1 /TAXON_ID=38269 /ORGANISM="Gloeochaete witrockiana, Strain SAG 46.84" /LENGTH=233 /DNA_ID=CAMNT_0027092607 /DNA_START=17 /DNA_END=718 /DNA_ORIENTATION=-